MPSLVEIPEVVSSCMASFADVFACEPQRKHFAEYLTGLMIAANKSVSGISGEFVGGTDQSCLNRFLTSVDWDVEEVNRRRLELLQEEPATRFHDGGVIALDNVLIDHDGKLIEDVGWFWDHAEERNKIAHDYLFANYVCSSGKHYPLEFRRFRKRDQCAARGEEFRDHNVLFRELVDWACDREIPGDFTFDSYFTHADTLNHIHSKQDRFGRPRGYVGDLKLNRKIASRGKEIRVDEFASAIQVSDRKEIRRGDQRQWYFTCTVRIPRVSHKVRLLIIWNNRRDPRPRKVLVTNKTNWEVKRTLACYRYRWTGTETFHRDGKQHLGMGDCQLRSGQGQTRHMHLVMLAYSLLMRKLEQRRVRKSHKPTTIGEACKAAITDALRRTIEWAIEKATQRNLSVAELTHQLGLTP